MGIVKKISFLFLILMLPLMLWIYVKKYERDNYYKLNLSILFSAQKTHKEVYSKYITDRKSLMETVNLRPYQNDTVVLITDSSDESLNQYEKIRGKTKLFLKEDSYSILMLVKSGQQIESSWLLTETGEIQKID